MVVWGHIKGLADSVNVCVTTKSSRLPGTTVMQGEYRGHISTPQV